MHEVILNIHHQGKWVVLAFGLLLFTEPFGGNSCSMRWVSQRCIIGTSTQTKKKKRKQIAEDEIIPIKKIDLKKNK